MLIINMRVIAKKRLKDFWESPGHGDSEQPLRAWYRIAKHAVWKTPNDIKRQFRSASIVGNNRVVFNIAGNKYRLVVSINYDYRIIYVRFIGTHKQYDRIKAKEV